MTRALRWLEEAERRWATRPAAPPVDWLPPPPYSFGTVPGDAVLLHGADRVWTEGTVVWGHVLLANVEIWAPGPDASVGEVLWSEDPYLRRFPEPLDAAREAFWALRRADTPAAGLRALVPFTRDVGRGLGPKRFPPLLSGGRVLQRMTLYLYRQHLPGARLVHNLLPLLRVRSGEPEMVAVLPAPYWPEDLARSWIDTPSPGEDA